MPNGFAFRVVSTTVLSLFIACAFLPGMLSAGDQYQSRAKNQPTELMQQSDYQRRAHQQEQASLEERQMAAISATEDSSDKMDYLVIIILVASAAALLAVSGRARRSRSPW